MALINNSSILKTKHSSTIGNIWTTTESTVERRGARNKRLLQMHKETSIQSNT